MSDEQDIDLIRQALQVHVNECGEEEGMGGGNWLVMHFVAVVGLCRVDPDSGDIEHCVIVVNPGEQPGYITGGLLTYGEELLTSDDCEANPDP